MVTRHNSPSRRKNIAHAATLLVLGGHGSLQWKATRRSRLTEVTAGVKHGMEDKKGSKKCEVFRAIEGGVICFKAI